MDRQLEIPVPESPNAKLELSMEDQERIYAELMGAEALSRQKELAREARTCTCRSNGGTRLHEPGCPLLRKR